MSDAVPPGLFTLPTCEQLRAIRAAFGWTQEQAAERAGVSTLTVHRLETDPGGGGYPRATVKTVRAVLDVYADAWPPRPDADRGWTL